MDTLHKEQHMTTFNTYMHTSQRGGDKSAMPVCLWVLRQIAGKVV